MSEEKQGVNPPAAGACPNRQVRDLAARSLPAKPDKRRLWTAGEIETVARLYPDDPTKKIAAQINRTVLSVYQAADKLGLHKTTEFLRGPDSGILRKGEMRPEGIATQFRPGRIPANKGLRRPGWAKGRMKETWFQRGGARKGIAARNWRPIGTILPDGSYLRIKVREAVHGKEATGFGNTKVWRLLQRHVWEQQHGPIPRSHVIVFRDGNRSNCALENLECISRADLARRNAMWNRMPPELISAIMANVALKRKIRSLTNAE